MISAWTTLLCIFTATLISQNSQYVDVLDSLFKVLEGLFSASRRGILRYVNALSTYWNRCLVMLAAVYRTILF